MTPRVLLLQEDQATGGVSTITNTLCQALSQQGWSITELALNRAGWRERLTVARQCDVILASHNFRPAYLAWALGRLARKPVVVWVHGPLQEVLAQAHASALKRAWLRWLYRRVPRFVFVSQASRDSFECFMQWPSGRHHDVVIPNAVVPTGSSASPVRSGTAPASMVQLAFIGRLSQEKQPDLLLDMLRLLPPRFCLTLVGEGPLRETLQQDGADLLAGGRLTLTGQQAQGPGLYASWQLTLLASRYEGCPMTLLESFAAGVACVGLPIPALQEVLGNDAPYLLARDHSAQALADAVQSVVAMPAQKVRDDMAGVLLRHTMNDFTQRWQTVLQEAVRRC